MMVKQKRILIEVSDIAAFRIQCGKCGNEVVLRLTNGHGFPDNCPVCMRSWRPDTALEQPPRPEEQLLGALRKFLLTDPAGLMTIQLELHDPD